MPKKPSRRLDSRAANAYVAAAWLFALPLFSACGNMFKTEEEQEADRIALEVSRAQAFGASGAAFSPDGSLAVIGTRDMIWAVDTGTRVTTSRLSHRDVSRFGGKKSLQFVDNRRILVGSEGAILLWDLNEASVTDRLELNNRMLAPRAIAWSDAAGLLAFSSGSTTEPVTIVHLGEDGFEEAREFPGFEGVPADLLFSRDGLYLAATGDGDGVHIRSVKTGDPVGELPTEGFAENLELFGENQLLVSGASVAIWRFLQGEESREFEDPGVEHQITNQVVVRVAGTVALGTLEFLTWLYSGMMGVDAQAEYGVMGKFSYPFARSPIDRVRQPWCGRTTAVSTDGKWLVDIYPGITSEIIRVFDLESGEIATNLNPRGEYSCQAIFSPDSKQLLLTTEKVVRLYETGTWRYQDLELSYPR